VEVSLLDEDASVQDRYFDKRCLLCTRGTVLGTDDVVWHKLKGFQWWPALILPIEERPICLEDPPDPWHVPLQYFCSKNFSWSHIKEILTFKISKKMMLRIYFGLLMDCLLF
jgi:hypothetical protein